MKKMIIVAFAMAALAACGGKKKPDTMGTGSDMGSAAGSAEGSGDMGGSAAGSGDGSAAPEGGGSGM